MSEKNSSGLARAQGQSPILLVLIALAIVIVYGIASTPNDFVYDDVQMIQQKDATRSLGDVGRAFGKEYLSGLEYYRPVSEITLLAQKAVHGEDPQAFHWFNAMLAGLVFLVAAVLLEQPAFGATRNLALWGAALLALHPVASSCVYPTTGREVLLSSLFALLSLYGFLRPGWNWAALAIVCFGLGLFAREQVIVLPLLFVVAEFCSLVNGKRESGQRVAIYASVIGLVLLYLGIRMRLFAGQDLQLALFDDRLGPIQSLIYALQTTFAPSWSLQYEPPVEVWYSWPRLTLALFALAVVGWLVGRTGPRFRSVAWFCAAWFVLTQLPTANIVVQETRFSERYVFLALFGVVAATASALSRAQLAPALRKSIVGAGIFLLAASAMTTLHRATYYRDHVTFTQQWIRSNPRSAVGHMGLAVWLVREGDYRTAIPQFEKAIELRPDYVSAHFNLGEARFQTGRFPEAIDSYRAALALNPELADAVARIGDALRAMQRTGEAIAEYERALRIDPDLVAARIGLGNALLSLGRPDEAISEYRAAIRSEPNSTQAHFNLGTTLMNLGRPDEAVPELRRALELNPTHVGAHANLAMSLIAQGDLDGGIEQFREGTRLDPHSAGMRFNLARALDQAGRSSEAIRYYREALPLAAGNPALEAQIRQRLSNR